MRKISAYTIIVASMLTAGAAFAADEVNVRKVEFWRTADTKVISVCEGKLASDNDVGIYGKEGLSVDAGSGAGAAAAMLDLRQLPEGTAVEGVVEEWGDSLMFLTRERMKSRFRVEGDRLPLFAVENRQEGFITAEVVEWFTAGHKAYGAEEGKIAYALLDVENPRHEYKFAETNPKEINDGKNADDKGIKSACEIARWSYRAERGPAILFAPTDSIGNVVRVSTALYSESDSVATPMIVSTRLYAEGYPMPLVETVECRWAAPSTARDVEADDASGLIGGTAACYICPPEMQPSYTLRHARQTAARRGEASDGHDRNNRGSHNGRYNVGDTFDMTAVGAPYARQADFTFSVGELTVTLPAAEFGPDWGNTMTGPGIDMQADGGDAYLCGINGIVYARGAYSVGKARFATSAVHLAPGVYLVVLTHADGTASSWRFIFGE